MIENEWNAEKLYLTDLIDVEVLQRIQNAFSDMTGMAAITTDADGRAVTEGTNFSDFCMKYTRGTTLGRKCCEVCDKFGAEQTLRSGVAATYSCHAGLIDFAAPIVVQGKQIGCFIGGQILAEEPDLDHMRKVAVEIGVDPDEYVEAAKRVKIKDKDEIDKAAEFLYEISYVLSDIAYGKYAALLANEEIKRASKLKSDFLANMSHEIRTPMNAVIGMAEMALWEDLPPVARDYIQQIKASGRELLAIINDILDFSKIESGKMDICPVEYETMSIVNDVVNIIMTRLKDKDVELILHLMPDIPRLLLGDNIRIKQILINIANNAAKFTNEGRITISMSYERKSDSEIMVRVTVEDTGIGIKKNDLDKLFQSFQQVDSKRNRNVEGTGLGLAISKQLLTLMGGGISVQSEYGKGSAFSFEFPQKIVDDTPSIRVKNAAEKAVAVLIANKFVKEQILTDCQSLGVECAAVSTEEEFLKRKGEQSDKEWFVFIDKEACDDNWRKLADEQEDIYVIMVTDFFDMESYDIANLLVMKKPIYALNIATLLENKEVHVSFAEDKEATFDFIAPDAEILVVDDNAINLTVVEGMLRPLQVKIQTALSGKEAIERISVQHYDIIFMDHMMPEMDGVETTHVIRRFYEEYNDVPIIALTANAVDGTRDMFLREGMNDFVAKPIELRTLMYKIKQWLPVEKVKKVEGQEAVQIEAPPEKEITVGDLDTKNAIRLLGSEQLFWSLLENYYKTISHKADLIQEMQDKEDWARYTIEVHQLKSLSAQVGATGLSGMAAELEKAGNARDTEYIHTHTAEALEKYRGYLSVLEPYFEQEEQDDVEKEEMTPEILKGFLEEMLEAAENLDMDHMEEVISNMDRYYYSDTEKALFEKLSDAVEEIDTDACEEIVSEWKELIS